MTTEHDHGNVVPARLRCELGEARLFSSLVLAVRDLRTASGRDEATGAGAGNASWIGLSLAMTVLDSLTPERDPVGIRLRRLLTAHGITADDAAIITELRHALLHGYGLPKPEKMGGRQLFLAPNRDRYALDTSVTGIAVLSVPVFCGHLVERIVSEAPGDWDTSLINVNTALPAEPRS